MAKYSFATPGLYGKLTARQAAKELERIRGIYGDLQPEFGIQESRDEKSLLHNIFEWDDTTAAEQYRKQQARGLINNIRVEVTNNDVQCCVRAFVNVRTSANIKRSYIPTAKAILDETAYTDLLIQAKADMHSFVTMYSQITELNAVKAEMLKALNQLK